VQSKDKNKIKYLKKPRQLALFSFITIITA
jgi:hypothetical protein